MNFKRKTVLMTQMLLLLVIALLLGCAEERDPVNRVQPYALSKSFFIGNDYNSADDDPEFWAMNSIVDVGYGASQFGLYPSTWAQTPTSRIKWQITEDFLIGRAAYERIEMTDGKGLATGLETQDGVVVSVFAIKKHFDIVNAYNPTTGEQLNILEENATDRPWNEREFIRVDWSKNLNTDSYDFDTLSMVGVAGGIEYEPLAYFVDDPNDEDAPVIDVDGGYFDITTKAFAKPGVIDLSSLGWGLDTLPACWLDADFMSGTAPAGNCNPVEITVRHSFRRVVDTDYAPIDWDGWKFQAYGGFSMVERMGYARNYGMTDSLHRRFLTRYPIWERHHYYENPEEMTGAIECYVPLSHAEDKPNVVGTPHGADPHRDEDMNGTEDECEAVTALTGFAGSRCDEFKQKCTLPFRARKQVVIPWYYTKGGDQRFYEQTELAAQAWDVALRTSVISAQYAECVNTAQTDEEADACGTAYPMYKGQQTDNDDAVALALEMDDCRSGRTQPQISGLPYSEEREASCKAQVAVIGNNRGITSTGVLHVATDMPKMIAMCHSPVEAGDHPACAPPEERLPAGITALMCDTALESGDLATIDSCVAARNVRRGDLRYHQINAIKEPMTPSSWGIYSDFEDPLTGETIAVSANIFTWVNDVVAQRTVDWIRYAAGDLSTEDVTDAEDVANWAKAAEISSKGSGGILPTMSKKEVTKRVNAISGAPADVEINLNPNLRETLANLKEQFTGVLADGNEFSSSAAAYMAREKALMNTEIEAGLMTPAMRQMYGVDNMPLTDTVMNFASPIRGGSMALRRDMNRLKNNAMARRGICHMDMAAAPHGISGLSNILQQKFGAFESEDEEETVDKKQARVQAMVNYVAQKLHFGVIAHEMGHSVGLRHNFISSADAYNYRPQYWQLRTDNDTVLAACEGLTEQENFADACSDGEDNDGDGDFDCDDIEGCGACCPNGTFQANAPGCAVAAGEACVGPRYYDPITSNEKDNLVWMWMQSSVMDYPGEITQEFLGPGAYDFAATRMFYGDTVAVYPKSYMDISSSTPQLKNRALGAIKKLDNFGGILGIGPTYGDKNIHYSAYPGEDRRFDNSQQQFYYEKRYEMLKADSCHPVDVDAFIPGRYNAEEYGTWNPVLDGNIVAVNGEYTRCKQPEVDYVPWSTLTPPSPLDVGSAYLRSCTEDLSIGWVLDKDRRVRVPYGFATDRWADLGNASVYRHDNGADVFEIFNYFISKQELLHVFENYRRGQMNFSINRAVGRSMSRYHSKLRNGAKGLSLIRNIIAGFAAETGNNFGDVWADALQKDYPQNAIAAGIVFDHFTRMMQRPQSGGIYLPHEISGDLSEASNQEVWRSLSGANFVLTGGNPITIPNGAYGAGNGFEDFAWGGKLLENTLDETEGEFESNYMLNAGSYYEKINVPFMLTESVDNFIADQRPDFLDKRYRAVSVADLMPEGFRRWLGNNLTGDDYIKGVRIPGFVDPFEVDGVEYSSVKPITWQAGIPAFPMATTSWWTDTPKVCLPIEGASYCYVPDGADLGDDEIDLNNNTFDAFAVIDPQVGWEQQMFIIAQTLIHLPENQQRYWVNQMSVWELGANSGENVFDNRIEFHMPGGRSYIAQTFGTEEIFGNTVQKGVAARVLEWANVLLDKAYVTQPVYDESGNLMPWRRADIDAEGNSITPIVDCSILGPGVDGVCTCEDNKYCAELERYQSVPRYLQQALWMLDWIDTEVIGIF